MFIGGEKNEKKSNIKDKESQVDFRNTTQSTKIIFE